MDAQVKAGSFETAGLRGADQMEDRHLLASPLGPEEPEAHLLGIFDGHRGAQTAEYAAASLPGHLRDCWDQGNPEQALKVCLLMLPLRTVMPYPRNAVTPAAD